MQLTLHLTIYCLLILLASLAGGWLPLLLRLTHRQMQMAVSLVAGVMLGVGLLHLLPHALIEARGGLDQVFYWALGGFLTMFFIERFFCFHHHDVPGEAEACAAQPEPSHRSSDPCVHSHELSWSGAAVGLSLHTVINGIALAAAVEAESHGGHVGLLVGFSTFLVIFLHKPFDAMTISALMTVGGWPLAARHLVNALFALMIPLGVLLFQFGVGHAGHGSPVVAYALAFSAGTFLCIATSDLLPELQFHRHDRVALSVALLLGLSVSWVIGLIETRGLGHSHHHPPTIEHEQPDPHHETDGHPGHDHHEHRH